MSSWLNQFLNTDYLNNINNLILDYLAKRWDTIDSAAQVINQLRFLFPTKLSISVISALGTTIWVLALPAIPISPFKVLINGYIAMGVDQSHYNNY